MTHCPECGETARKNATFCDFCGADLPQEEPEPRQVIRPVLPRRMLRSMEVVPASKAVVNISRTLFFIVSLTAGGILTEAYLAPGEEASGWIALLFFLPIVFYLLNRQRLQMAVLNSLLGERRFSFATWVVWSLVTAGLYTLFIEWRMAKTIREIQRENSLPGTPGLANLCLGLSVMIPVLGTVISIFIQQHEINRFYNPPDAGEPGIPGG